MDTLITRFCINNLWNQKRVELEFIDNRLIIVGENGSGKTTVLRMLFEALACRWGDLLKEEFDSIEIQFSNNDSIHISYEDVETAKQYLLKENDPIIVELPSYIKVQLKERYNLSTEGITFEQIREALDEFGFSDYIDITNNKYLSYVRSKIGRIEKAIRSKFDYSIYYLPTYRRIEKSSNRNAERDSLRRRQLFVGRQRSSKKDVYEIAKSGMFDVEISIDDCLDKIRRNADASATKLNYQCFKGILTKTSNTVKFDEKILDSDSIEAVFGRIDEAILSGDEVKQIKDLLITMGQGAPTKISAYEQIVYYFYSMLYQRYLGIKKDEEKVITFFNVCNTYLTNKSMDYYEGNYSYTISIIDETSLDKREIDLEHLSSGEKQIVSMFSYLYLTANKRVFVIIDEPELSLSVPWQKKFLLDISNGDMCGGVVAVTHSPFVYDNALISYAKSMNQFIK